MVTIDKEVILESNGQSSWAKQVAVSGGSCLEDRRDVSLGIHT